MSSVSFRRSSVWVTCLVVALLASCSQSTTTALDPVLNNPAVDPAEEEGTVTLNLSEVLSNPVERMAATVIVVIPAALDGNGDFFVGVGQFAPGTTIFNVSDLLVAGVLEADYLAQGSLIISFSPNQNQTIITLRNRTTGVRVRIRIRGGDFRGQISLANFIFDQPTIVASLIVNTLVDQDGTESDCSLRESIIANNTDADFGGCADPQGTITFDPILNGNTITLTAAPPQITQNLKVNGPGSNTLAVSGNNLFRVFDIGSNLPVTIDGLTITNGSTSGNGGGIYARNDTTLTVSNSILSGNSAGSEGGGIFAFSTATVSNSTLSSNSATFGGGISTDSATISTSTLSDNSAGTYGGGIFASNAATVSTSTLSGNSAE
ncbi:MAG: hypothetical protein HC924_13720 [Synechococcaceae cyanobacterium SM2_3_2]|nr:hypothetical protein [Synechococcaceae cyanobacterium SM2_3_2]